MLALLKINPNSVYHASPCKSKQLVFCKSFLRIYVFFFPLHILLYLAEPAVHYALFCFPSESYFLKSDKFWLLFLSLKKKNFNSLFLFWVPDTPSVLRFCKTSKTAYSAPQSQICYKWCSNLSLSFSFSCQVGTFQMNHSFSEQSTLQISVTV